MTEGFNKHSSVCEENERLLAKRRAKEAVLEWPTSFSPSLELHSSGSWKSSLEMGEPFHQEIKESHLCCLVGGQNSHNTEISRTVLSAWPELCEKDTNGAGDIAAWIKIAVSGPKTCVHRRSRLKQTHKHPLSNRHEESH